MASMSEVDLRSLAISAGSVTRVRSHAILAPSSWVLRARSLLCFCSRTLHSALRGSTCASAAATSFLAAATRSMRVSRSLTCSTAHVSCLFHVLRSSCSASFRFCKLIEARPSPAAGMALIISRSSPNASVKLRRSARIRITCRCCISSSEVGSVNASIVGTSSSPSDIATRLTLAGCCCCLWASRPRRYVSGRSEAEVGQMASMSTDAAQCIGRQPRMMEVSL
mmetsp:Transcript_9415/g.19280  ORF Transcript_9415/g.19280 Transcript_9415/m.19280 type:complete len:224 (-) Transcript_9415:25-696(-)